MIKDFVNKIINLIKSKDYKGALIEIENYSDSSYPYNNNPILLYYLAFIKNRLNEKEKALEILNLLTKKKPDFTEAHHLSSNINEDLKRYDISKKILEALIEKNPNNWKANYNLGRLHKIHLKNKNKALKYFQKALENNQNNNDIWSAVGNLQKDLNHYEEAVNTFTNIIKKFPENYKNFIQLADMQLSTGLIDMAEKSLIKAMELSKDNEKVMNLLGSCYLRQSRLDEAEDIFKKIISFNLKNKEESLSYRNLLITKVYKNDYDQNSLSKIIDQYINKFGNKEKKNTKIEFRNNKKIRIGFVSADFRTHSINNVIHSLFINKDKKKFEFYCYYSNNFEDNITKWYKNNSNSWKNIYKLTDIEASNLIISNNIDILIFLGGYTEKNRFLLATYRSASKQISLHPITSSNIKKLDYWITDSYLNPPDIKEKTSEKLIRIESLFNFSKVENKLLPRIKESPMKKNNFISFSSFNNPAKISLESLNLWQKVLNNFKDSKLYLKYFNFLNNQKIQNRICDFFEKKKINHKRIIFIKQNNEEHFLECYNNIDIALDTFPYSGATTTYGAICMGVPVFTLTGKNYISRQSASVLESVGLSEWVAKDKNKYIETLKKLANLKIISTLRNNLREQIKNSYINNDINFYKNFESSIEQIINE